MRTIGLIGGLSWESTALYYRYMNEQVKERLGGLHSAKLLLWSFDMEDISILQMSGNWQAATDKMVHAATILKQGGADALIICTNTMHKMASEVQTASDLPLIHIIDVTAAEIQARGLKKVGLLGTRFTMEQDFYRARYSEKFGIDVIIPDETDRLSVHRIIYEELCKGRITAESKETYKTIIHRLAQQGAEGIILGCTEIGLLITQEDADVPLLDTTYLHAKAAIDYALAEDEIRPIG